MIIPDYEEYQSTTGLFYHKRTDKYYSFFQKYDSVFMNTLETTNYNEIIHNRHFPLWMLRHSLGVPGGHEDYSTYVVGDHEKSREEELGYCVNSEGKLKDMDFAGISINIDQGGYAHAVGPIHAGVIEPGHFRFSMKGEVIKLLMIRLGFQKRNIREKIINQFPVKVMPFSEVISGDSTVAYSTAFSNIYEEAMDLPISDEVKLIRMILLELERIAIHIGDMGAIAGDIGYYPLHGLCATDRGVPLGVMEALTGSRFGRGAIFPGEVRLNPRLKTEDLKKLANNIHIVFKSVEKHFLRATRTSTIRERLHDCGKITKLDVLKNGFVGMPARCTGMKQDMRYSEPLYQDGSVPLGLNIESEYLNGDAWARFYLRYLEYKNSCLWLENVIPNIDITKSGRGKLIVSDVKKCRPGLYYKSIEGWRGPVLVALDLSKDCKILDSYIRDPSVTNWHALELSVRGELIGDFPLNNKSFNLSYVGFDL
ncbi:MAG: metal (Ni/Fe) hydrogenase large subunit [Leptospiraceae bacterium]|nr:metal (Ni/Fe) hydrogenase large subunit [Leptospiraceae bacterium]